MILSDLEIVKEIEAGNLDITPFDYKMVQPASYDLKIGRHAATTARDGNLMVDLEKQKFLLVQPYAPAVIWSLETLKLPLTVAGRFGLKSSLSRRGIYASVGPQVDPGFKGKLSVTLFNLTPVPFAVNYSDAFLSLELHRLASPPSRGYIGEYQGRESFTAKEIEPVLGYKGHGLTQVVEGFAEIHDAVATVADLSKKFYSFLDGYEKQNRELAEFNRALLAEMKRTVEHMVQERRRALVPRAVQKRRARNAQTKGSAKRRR